MTKLITTLSFSSLVLCAAAAAPAAADTVRLIPLDGGSVSSLSGSSCILGARAAEISGPAFVDVPTSAAAAGWSGESRIRVAIDAAGKLVSSSLIKSSGRAFLDEAALTAARGFKYVPAIEGCTPVGGNYAVDFDFSS